MAMKSISEGLLDEARELMERRKKGIAVVVAHMACEVAVDQALAVGFTRRSLNDLAPSVRSLVRGNSLADDRIRKFYAVVTGDDIARASFWNRYTASIPVRNKVVHSGMEPTIEQAEASLAAATEFVEHVMTKMLE